MSTQARIELTAHDATAQAFRSIERNFSGLQSSADRMRNIFAGLGGVLSVGAFVAFAKNAVSSAAALDDMAETTGATVEGLSKLTDIARISGQDIGQVETALVRLTKALSGSDEESKGAGAAFAALGLSFKQLQQLAPDKALEEIARAFAKFEDGAGKTSAALAIFGKSGAQLLPLLKDIADNLERTGSLTAQQAADAEKLEKAWNGLTMEAANLGRNLVTSVAPAMTNLIQQFTEGRRIAGGFMEALKLFGVGLSGNKSPLEEMDRLEKLRATLEKAQSGKDDPRVQAARAKRLEDIQKQIEFLNLLQTQQNKTALAGFEDQPAAAGKSLPFVQTESAKKASLAVKEALLDPWQRFADLVTGPDSPAALAQESTDKLTTAARKAREEFLGLIDPARSAYQDLRRFEELAPLMGLTADEAERIRDALREKIDVEEWGKPLKDFAEDTKDEFAGLTDAINGWSRQATQAFVDFAFGAKTSIGDMLTSIAKQFAAMQLQRAVFDRLFGAAGELLKDVFQFHRGGIVGAEGVGAFAPALAFAGAPRFHGGMGPDEYPAILQRGEGVFTPGQMRALGGAGEVRVEIRNEGTPQRVVSAAPSFDARGMVIGIVTRDLATNGPIAQSMGSLMGVRR